MVHRLFIRRSNSGKLAKPFLHAWSHSILTRPLKKAARVALTPFYRQGNQAQRLTCQTELQVCCWVKGWTYLDYSPGWLYWECSEMLTILFLQSKFSPVFPNTQSNRTKSISSSVKNSALLSHTHQKCHSQIPGCSPKDKVVNVHPVSEQPKVNTPWRSCWQTKCWPHCWLPIKTD